MEKTEIWSASQRTTWKALQIRFKKPPLEIFPEDPSLPASKSIGYYRLELISAFFLACCSFYLIGAGREDNARSIGTLGLVFTVYLIWRFDKNHRKNGKTFLILDATGVYLQGKTFIPWEEIQRYWISREGTGKSAKYFLYLNADRGHEILPLEEANVGHNRLEYLLDVYFGRFRQQEAD